VSFFDLPVASPADLRNLSYTMVFAFPVLFVGWKLWHKTKFHKPHEADLYKDKAAIDEYERNFVSKPAEYVPPLTVP
jgi:amino acid permease